MKSAIRHVGPATILVYRADRAAAGRCPLCCRPHFFDARSGEERSCGRNQKTFYPPEWRWTKSTMMAAVDGTYRPGRDATR